MSIEDQFSKQTYLSLETFRKNGVGVKTPVWFVQDAGKLFVRTIADSGKVKRIRNNPQINVCPCKVDGESIGSWTASRAHEVHDAPALEESINRLFDKKYGQMNREMTHRAAETGRKYTILELDLD